MRNIPETIKKVKKLGLGNTIRGFIIKSKYKSLRRKITFDPWHVVPLELRRYAVGLSRLLADQMKDGAVIVEIGCGLGDILRAVYDRKPASAAYYGFDISPEAILAAKHLNEKRNIKFFEGSFADVKNHVQYPIDWLIAVNFFHCIEKDAVSAYFQSAFSSNPVRHILVDVSPNNGIKHDFSEILPPEYRLEYTSEPYEGGRLLQIFGIRGDDV